ncbi:MAG TPA: bifunctional demethylmenaquinone methyltransferase/2-methoxy-6-polyprenyl-1,4-benzoquinol methylase UbiE [Thermomicrobiales bacterium]|nr:bifunctional demethylmenaquinone methyltransferase/2-methoxy-6-polyprenyl-1,4-benzoquinol methylase UbiE [Thermomicrobiales bacterium]
MKEEGHSLATGGAIRSRDDVRTMFDRIVPRYDLMNRLMTGGRDVAWRRLAVREVLRGRNPAEARILDVATGTGDLALAIRDAGVADVVGLDFSAAMLDEAIRKDTVAARDGRIAWVEGDAMSLPFPDASFDAVTVAFGLRNMPSYPAALREMARVLRPGGTLVCLETTPLQLPVLRAVFAWYFSRVVPIAGGLLSGDRDAYRYLPASAAVFPDADTLGQMMLEAGFSRVRYLRLGLGTVALHVAAKSGT